MVPGALLGVFCYLVGGWPGLAWGFFLSTILVYHVTFMVNSVCHLLGKRRFATDDDSRNNWVVALLTFGEGWHNNHHHYPSAARQGFRWYEIDISYATLKFLSWFGIVWDLRQPTERALSVEDGRKIVESDEWRAVGEKRHSILHSPLVLALTSTLTNHYNICIANLDAVSLPVSAESTPLDDPSLYLNRELSWLQFNHRVLEEAQDPNVPLLERLKFLAIYSANLDEFFMVRVGNLHQKVQAGISRGSGADRMSAIRPA